MIIVEGKVLNGENFHIPNEIMMMTTLIFIGRVFRVIARIRVFIGTVLGFIVMKDVLYEGANMFKLMIVVFGRLLE